jgi:hypothetical protein
MLEDLQKHSNRIETYRDALIPDVRWDGRRLRSNFIK